MRTTPLQLDHVALQVFDARAAYRFYRDVLQLRLVDALSGEGWDGHDWLMMLFALHDGRQLALCALRGAPKPTAPRATDLPHLAFAVGSETELAAWEQRLKAHEVAIREENHGAQRSLYFEDPDGFTLEITAPPSSAGGGEEEAAKTVEHWLAAR
jgi:catechol 2,3-dioxygenase-like lactoylglutathione lyase family enzyme